MSHNHNKDQSCSSHGHSHGHCHDHKHEHCHESHGHEDGCCSHEHNHCHEESSCSEHHHQKSDCEGTYAEKLIQLADQAWMEVVKDKIKQEILKHSGEHLDQLAKLVASYNCKRWHEKVSQKKGCAEFQHQLQNLMCCHKNK